MSRGKTTQKRNDIYELIIHVIWINVFKNISKNDYDVYSHM